MGDATLKPFCHANAAACTCHILLPAVCTRTAAYQPQQQITVYSRWFATCLLQSMDRLGDSTLKPFLQDVIQLRPLVQTLGSQASVSGAGVAAFDRI